jgi:predicted O-linked N-acetylglucosamine transferase (SPINDLY family)
VARRIHQDGLTILVGQEGYFQDAVVQVLARRVAPVQVAWSGYPHGWGLPTVDARITDAVLDPPECDGLPGFERLVRLPWFRSFLPPADAPEPGPLPALERGHATFVSFNNLAKIGPECLDLWARVLAAAPAARLTVAQAEAGRLRDGLAARMAAAGLPLDRITFLPRLPEAEYLRLHREADLHLDTAPYPGVTVSATALWMGLPSVCLNQDWAAAREGAAQVVAAGFPELVAEGPEAFVALNARLASNLPALTAFRAGARERVRTSRLLDGAGLARNLEDAYFRLAAERS